MKVQSPLLVNPQDVAEAPEWFRKVLKPINASLGLLFGAIAKRLSAQDNFNSEIRQFEVFHNTEFQFKLQTLKGLPRDIRIGQVINPVDYGKIQWRISPNDSRVIIATCKFDQAPVAATTIRLVIDGD